MTNDALLTKIRKMIEPVASEFKVKKEYWIDGWDEGLSFCYECANKKVDELLRETPKAEYGVAGGWGQEGDSLIHCEICHEPLDNSFTDYACGTELDHFEGAAFNLESPEDCYCLSQVLDAHPFEGGEHSKRIRKLCRKIVGGRP